MTEIEYLKIALDKKEDYKVLYGLCKKMRNIGVSSELLQNFLQSYMDENQDVIDKDEVFEDILYDLMSALVGYCNSEHSLK